MYAYEGSPLENRSVPYGEVQPFLERFGFVVGGGWEVDHGYFDHKLDDHPAYLYLRIPGIVEQGSFGDPNAILRLGTPFLLRHQYQQGIDREGEAALISGTINQFASPEAPDAELAQEEIERGRRLLLRVEEAFQAQFGS